MAALLAVVRGALRSSVCQAEQAAPFPRHLHGVAFFSPASPLLISFTPSLPDLGFIIVSVNHCQGTWEKMASFCFQLRP